MNNNQNTDELDYSYFEEFKVPFCAKWGVCDDGLIYKNKIYDWSEIKVFSADIDPSKPSENGECKALADGKTLHLVYSYKDKERVAEALDFFKKRRVANREETKEEQRTEIVRSNATNVAAADQKQERKVTEKEQTRIESNQITRGDDQANKKKARYTAESLWAYCLNNKLCPPTMEKHMLKNLQVIIDALDEDEKILFCFGGLHNFKSVTKHDNDFAYAFTNKRILLGQDYMFAKNIKSVSYDNVNDVTMGTLVVSTISIDTIKENIVIGVNKECGKIIYGNIQSVLNKVRGGVTKNATQSSQAGAADEILKYKQLLDSGAITQEEYDAKKKQLLGL